jgi:DNA-binding XRE family transcriptional regulator
VAAPRLMSLRPAAPGCTDVRILFTLGTEGAPVPAAAPGAVLLLAAAARHPRPPGEPEALITQALGRYWRSVAVGSSRAADLASTPGGLARYDRASFAAELFPGEAAALAEEADGLVARTRPRGLAELRGRSGLTQSEVAGRLGVRQERASAIERGELSAAELRTLAAYVAALGGRLEIAADFGAERFSLA